MNLLVKPPSAQIKEREVPELQNSLHENELIHRILAARGVLHADELNAALKDLPRPDLLPNIDKAVKRLISARERNEKVLIVGDYDCDGATSTAVAVLGLKMLGFHKVDYLLPNRFSHGYGLSPKIIDLALSNGKPDLILTVDNGVASVEGVEAAMSVSIDVVVTDHHLPPPELPEAVAIVNPSLIGSTFEGRCLAGVGVVFYTLLACRASLQTQKDQFAGAPLAQLLDLVAIGTVADLVPLDRINRILVEQGLRRIRHGSTRPGIRHLLQLSGKSQAGVSAEDIAFGIGPRLNAAGRVEDMRLGVQCLLAADDREANLLASQLDTLNQKRRSIERSMREQALAQFDTLQSSATIDTDSFSVCLHDDSWHQGVIGILAGRIKEIVEKPVVIFTVDEKDTLKGSARSTPGVHIKDVIQTIATKSPDMILSFGGHAMAAGVTLRRSYLDEFKLLLEQSVKDACQGKPQAKVFYVDGQLSQQEMTLHNAKLLARLLPWGQGFEPPLFLGHFVCLAAKRVGVNHLKLQLQMNQDNNGAPIDGIFFNTPDLPETGTLLQLVYSMQVNTWRGQESLQLQVHDLRPVALR